MNSFKSFLAGCAVLLGAVAAQAQIVVTPDEARALIAEQRQFLTEFSRGKLQGDRYEIGATVRARLASDGNGSIFVDEADAAHFNATRQKAAGARFLSYVDTAVDPGLRAALDKAFLDFITPVNHTGQAGPAQAYFDRMKPVKQAQLDKIVELLGRLKLALVKVAEAARIPERPADAAAGGGGAAPQQPGTTTPPPAPPAPPAQPTGGLIGVTPQDGPGARTAGAPAVPAAPAMPPGWPYSPPDAGIPPNSPLAPWQIPGNVSQFPQPPIAPGYPAGGPITIVIQVNGFSYNQLAQLLTILVQLMQQQAMQRPYYPGAMGAPAPAAPATADPFALERALYGTGGLVDQSSRAMGLRPGAFAPGTPVSAAR